VLVSGERLPTPAELEARERETRRVAPAAEPRAETVPEQPVKNNTRVVRIWLPASGN
jgi:hypothetical protein